MWAKVKDGAVEIYPYGPSELRRDNPNTSFPSVMSNEVLAGWGIVPVVPRDPPAHDYITQNCERIAPTMNGNTWVETWSVSPASPETVAQRTSEMSASVRSERNARLAACDWTQLPDAQCDATAWAFYRQALRDVPNQDGFPGSVMWPTPPE
jgi:hypothetical protein